jgi:mono/diheme cytochrome c family protein
MKHLLIASLILFSFAATLKEVSLKNDITPIFKAKCGKCHYDGEAKGQYDMTTYESLIKGGKHGTVINADKPLESTLYLKLTSDDPPFGRRMPTKGETLTDEETEFVKNWILQGAKNN